MENDWAGDLPGFEYSDYNQNAAALIDTSNEPIQEGFCDLTVMTSLNSEKFQNFNFKPKLPFLKENHDNEATTSENFRILTSSPYI